MKRIVGLFCLVLVALAGSFLHWGLATLMMDQMGPATGASEVAITSRP